MASWLKAAEDLLEVVDRRAKLVVSELSDEQFDSQPSASNGQHTQARRTKTKEGPSRLSSIETIQSIKPEPEEKSIQTSVTKVKAHKVDNSSYESSLDDGSNHTADVSSKLPSDTNTDTATSDIASSGVTQTGGRNDTNSAIEVAVTESNIDTMSSTNDEITTTNSKIVLERSSSSPVVGEEIEVTNEDHVADASPEVNSVDDDTSLKVDQARPESETVERHNFSHAQENERDLLSEPSPNVNKQQEPKTENSPMKVQDQLDEAQGLLKNAISTGQSKEARFVLGFQPVFKNTSLRMPSWRNFLLQRKSVAVHTKLA